MTTQRLLGAPRPPRLGSYPAQSEARADDRVAVELERGGDRDERERVARTVTHLAIRRALGRIGRRQLDGGDQLAGLEHRLDVGTILGQPVQITEVDRALA